MEAMRIGIYKDTLANGRGADVAVKNLAQGLQERGHDVTLFDKYEFDAKVRGDYDVIVSTGTNEILDLAKIDGLPPIVQQFHTDPRYPFRHWIRRWHRNRAIKAALAKVSAFQVLSQDHKGALSDVLVGVDPEKISVIGNWSVFEDGLQEGVGNGERNMILCPGAINKDKNQALLVDAFSEVAPEFPDWQVHIYGRGKEKEERALLNRISARGLSDRVLLNGYADLARPYTDCAFVAFPSLTEGFGMAILDAAMFGKPSLLLHDWIGCGEVVAPNDFAFGLRKLMSDAEYSHALGEKSRSFCLEMYSRRKIIDKWEELLNKSL